MLMTDSCAVHCMCYVFIHGSNSDPSQVVFGGEIVGESAVQFADQIGPSVKHTFEVSIGWLFVCIHCAANTA